MTDVRERKSDKSDKNPISSKGQESLPIKIGFSGRLKRLIDEKRISQKDLSLKSGIPGSKISDYVTGKFMPSAESLVALSEALDVRPAWLVLGNGPQHERSPEALGDHTVPVLDTWKALKYDTWENVDDLSIYDGQLLLDDRTMAQLGRADTRGLVVVINTGDAMSPQIAGGAPVIIDRFDRKPSEGIYAFVLGDDIRIRRLQRLGLNGIQAIPANPAYEAETYTGEVLDHFRIIGRAKWAGTLL